MKTRKSGFTLVEILIVVIILGILAAVVIPQFTDATTSAKENTFDSNIQSMQSMFELYRAQHNDEYPWNGMVVGAGDGTIITRLTTKTDEEHATGAGGNLGPYTNAVPENPFDTNAGVSFHIIDTGTAADAVDTADWTIILDTGAIVGHQP